MGEEELPSRRYPVEEDMRMQQRVWRGWSTATRHWSWIRGAFSTNECGGHG